MKFGTWLVVWLILLASSTVCAADLLEVAAPWIRDAPPSAAMRAGYVRLSNAGAQAIEIVGASSEDFGRVEMHRTIIKDGVSRMSELPSVVIPAGGSFVFEPGAAHFMLMRPTRRLQLGDRCRITLRYKNAAAQTLTFNVARAPTA